ncbi:MAG: hypothetical protein NWR30_05885 [Salibacteraceae bacterium]|nr:hypothetical protein [Salibacteraceae bacterium]
MSPKISRIICILTLLLCAIATQSSYGQTYTLSQKDSLLHLIEEADEAEQFQLQVQFYEVISNDFPEIGLKFLERLHDYALATDTVNILWYKIVLAKSLERSKDLETCIRICTEVKNDLNARPVQKFKANILLRSCYSDLGALDKAMEADREIDWSLANDNWEKNVPEFFDSMMYFKFGEFDIAISLIKESIRKLDSTDFDYWKMSLRNSLGVYFEHSNQLDSAFSYYDQALAMLKKNYEIGVDFSPTEYRFIEGLFIGNKGQILMNLGKYEEAIVLLSQDFESSSVITTHNTYKENQLLSALKLTECYVQTDQFTKAKSMLLKIHALESPLFLKHYEMDIARLNYLYEEAKGDSLKAFVYFKRYITIKDSISATNDRDKTLKSSIIYQAGVDEKMLENQLLHLSNLEQENQTQKRVLWILIVVGIIILSLCLFLLNAYRGKLNSERDLKTKNEQIENQKTIISKALLEKEILFKEVNHRVKNNLQIVSSLLYFQAKIVKDESAKKAMKEAQSRVLSMSFIHQKLYQTEDIGVIDCQNYISSLAEHICRNANVRSTDIKLFIEANSIDLSVQKSIPIGLILHELISNSVKHAFTNMDKGEINIAFAQTEKQITLHYSDSGPGARLSENETSDTIGKKLIFLLTSQLNGSLEQNPNNLAAIHFSFRVG